MIPHDPLIEITRSFAFKLNIGSYQSVDFFCSEKGQCHASQAMATSAALHDFCKGQVMAAVAEYREALELPVSTDRSDAAFQEQARKNREPEQNPFTVTDSKAAPSTVVAEGNTITNAPTGPISMSTPEPPAEKSNLDKDPTEQNQQPANSTTQNAPSNEAAKPEVEKPAARRGRPPATAKPAAGDGNKKADFVASDDDLPAAITKPEPVEQPAERIANLTEMPKPQKTQQERMGALTTKQAAAVKVTEQVAKAQIVTFLRAFMNVERIPKVPDPAYDPIIPLLEQIVEQYATRLAAAPQILGSEAGVGWNKFIRYIDSWEPEAKAVATAVAVERFCDDPEMLISCVDTFAEAAPGADELENVVAFLRMYRISISAMKMRELGVPAAKLLEQWGPITTEAELLSKLATGVPKVDEQPELWEEK